MGERFGGMRATASLLGFAVRRMPRLALLAAVLVPASRVLGTLSALWLKLLADAVVARDMRGALLAAALCAAGSGTAAALVQVEGRVRITVFERLGFALDSEVARMVAELPGLEHFERPEYLDRVEMLRQARGQLGQALSVLVSLVAAAVQVGTSMLLLAHVHPALLALTALGLPTLWATSWRQRRLLRVAQEVAGDARRRREWVELVTGEPGGRELRLFELGDEVARRHRALCAHTRRRQLTEMARTGVATTAGELVLSVGTLAAAGFTVVRAAGGAATAGDVLMTLTLARGVGSQLGELLSMSAGLVGVSQLMQHFRWLQRCVSSPARSAGPARVVRDASRGIRLRDVSFTYPGTDRPSLQRVTLDLPPGAVVALVGENGAGKTTLVKLLCRLYEPGSGEITVDGQPLTELDHAAWRREVAVGFQDFVRWELTARETAGIGELARMQAPGAVESALGRAGALPLALRLPDALGTQLGRRWEGGVELSWGQWQRLALGRALMRSHPRLLILDEPTAALDAATEEMLFERFTAAARRGAARGTVTVLVSHRFSTVRMADLIVVMEGGRITESGSHAQLVRNGRLYAELFELQARAYRDAPAPPRAIAV